MNERHELDVQPTPEVPIIIIERDDETDASVITSVPTPQRGGRFKKIALALLLALGCISVVVGYKVWAYYYGIAIPISVTPSENIEKLAAHKVANC